MTSVPEESSGPGLRPQAYEIVLLSFAAVSILIVRMTPLEFSFRLAKAFLMKGVEFVFIIYLFAVAVVLVRAFIHAREKGVSSLRAASLRDLAAPYLSLAFFTLTIRRIAATLGVFYFFLHIKHVILLVHTANYDRLFWDLDRLLHFGVQPSVWAMTTFGLDHNVTILVDWLYIKFFTYMLLASLLFFLEIGGRRNAQRYVFAFCLLWSAGGLAYIAAPADGPCYAALIEQSTPKAAREHLIEFPVITGAPREYYEIYEQSKIWIAKTFQERLWVSRKTFLIDGRDPGMFYGIAAMPSLHVAAVALIVPFLFTVAWPLGVAGALYTAVMFFGSILLQWHYAVDGYAGALLAGAVWWISGRVAGKGAAQRAGES